MILKGIIEQIIDNYTAKVRIPEYHKLKDTTGATSTENLPDAIISVMPGLNVSLQINDIALVAFENDLVSKPVIIGILQRESGMLSEADATLGELKVTSSAVLPKNTTIGNITAERLDTISFLIDQIKDTNLDAVIRRINHLDNSLELNYDSTKVYHTDSDIDLCDFVMYDSQLYKCKVASTTGPFKESDWTAVQIQSEIQDLWKETKDIWAKIEEVEKAGTESHGETVTIPVSAISGQSTGWTQISGRTDEYQNIVTLSNKASIIPNYAILICSYDTTFNSTFATVDAMREEWIDKDVYLKEGAVSGNNVNLTFIANGGKPTIELKAKLSVFTSEKNKPAQLTATVPNPMLAESTTVSQKQNNIYYLSIEGNTNWTEIDNENYPKYFKQFITNIPIQNGQIEIYPIIQPTSYGLNNASGIWLANKYQCFIDKIIKDENLSSEYFIANVYCNELFEDKIVFQIVNLN